MEIKTKYVCFIDNDVIVTKGWIEALVETAERTSAGIVFPLYLIGEPSEGKIHMAGGKCHWAEVDGRTEYNEEHIYSNQPLSTVADSLSEGESDFGEFHCMLISMEMLRELGPLDERYLQVNEHLDLCMAAHKADCKVIFQPRSVVSYLHSSHAYPFWLCDLEPYRRRWSHRQAQLDVEYFSAKWNVISMQKGNIAGFIRHQVNNIPSVLPLGDGKKDPGSRVVVDPFDYDYVSSLPRLLRQCLRRGDSREQVMELMSTFDIACQFHGSSFRASKKTFIEHLVRTASILVSHAAPMDMVKASLLHAIYMGHTSSSMHLECNGRNRSRLRQLVGAHVEAVVHAYFLASPGDPGSVKMDRDKINETPIPEAQASVVRIANDIEDLLDHAALLERKSLSDFRRVLEAHGAVARACGYHAMVEEFEARIEMAERLPTTGDVESGVAPWLIERLHDRSAVSRLSAAEGDGTGSRSPLGLLLTTSKRLVPFQLKVACKNGLKRLIAG